MGLRDWITSRFSAPGIEPSGAAVITTSYGLNGNESVLPNFVAYAKQAYTGNAIVFGAVLARFSLFSEATLCFQDKTDKSLFGANATDGRGNTSLRKLETPWPGGTTGELLARMIQDTDLAGNAYIWDAGDQLVRLRPDWVTIVRALQVDPLGRYYAVVIGYHYEPPASTLGKYGPPMDFDADEVMHWAPNPDPEADFRGMSWLTPVMREIWGDNAMTEYKIKYLENAASPNLLIKYSQKIGDTVVNKIRDRIAAKHSGVENAFRTLILDEGADVTVIGNSFEQMNFSTVQAAGENRILVASGVPGIVVGTKEGLMAATYSNYQQAMRRFADITMRPLWRSACAALAQLVTVPPNARLWFDVSDISALRQGEQEQADTMLVVAKAIAELVVVHFTPKSAVSAVTAGDMSLLVFDAAAALPPTPPDPSGAGGVAIPSPLSASAS
jgi:phage portal protein BeeE